jgi:hypothetical protein
MSITWIASPKRRAHTGLNDKIQAGSSQIQSEICPHQSPTRTLYNSLTHFLSILPPHPILLLYPRENGEFGGTGREWRYHSDVSVRPSTSQCGINIATTGVRCSFQHHSYVAPCISCLSLLLLIHFHIRLCKTRHPQYQATRLMETFLKTAYFVMELNLGLFDVFNS